MSRVDIIDRAHGHCHLDHRERWERTLEVELLPLAQFRSNGSVVDKEEAYEIIWSRTRGDSSYPVLPLGDMIWVERFGDALEGNKEIFHRSTNSTKLVLNEIEDDVREGDIISVDVRFFTEEVRVDVNGYLSGGGDWVIRKKCGR